MTGRAGSVPGASATGRRAVVTGGGSGIGLALVRQLAAAGSTVLAVDLRADTAGAVREAGGQLLVADVSDASQWPQLMSRAREQMGGLDLIALNAGMAVHDRDVAQARLEVIERAVAVNIWGVVHGMRAAIPVLEDSGGGDIIVTASLAGIRRYSEDPYYAMTKHAVVGLARSSARSLLAKHIRVTVICPGLIDTPLVPQELRETTLAAGRGLVPPHRAAEYVFAALDEGGSGRVWTVQDGPGLQEYLPTPVPMD